MGATDTMIALAAIGGVIAGIERARAIEALPGAVLPWAHLAIVLTLAIVAGVEADSVRGFAYGLLMPIGAFTLARVIAEPLAMRVDRARATAEYDRWFRGKVEKSIASDEPSVPHGEAMESAQHVIDAARHRREQERRGRGL